MSVFLFCRLVFIANLLVTGEGKKIDLLLGLILVSFFAIYCLIWNSFFPFVCLLEYEIKCKHEMKKYNGKILLQRWTLTVEEKRIKMKTWKVNELEGKRLHTCKWPTNKGFLISIVYCDLIPYKSLFDSHKNFFFTIYVPFKYISQVQRCMQIHRMSCEVFKIQLLISDYSIKTHIIITQYWCLYCRPNMK